MLFYNMRYRSAFLLNVIPLHFVCPQRSEEKKPSSAALFLSSTHIPKPYKIIPNRPLYIRLRRAIISRSQTRIRVEKAAKSFFRQIVGKYFVICAFKAQGSTEYLTSCRKIEAIFEEGCNITLCEVSAVFESLRLP